MAANIRTIEEAKFIKSANDVQTYSEVKSTVELKLAEAKKALIGLILPTWEEDLQECAKVVTNFKIPSGELVEVGDGDDASFELESDGGVIQVVMKVPTSELDPALIPQAEVVLGAHYKKLFKEETIIDTVSDPVEFLKRAAEHPKADKLFKLGATGASFGVPDAEFFDGYPGIELRTRTINNTSFLSKINDLPKDVLESAQGFLSEYLNEHLSPTVTVGNRTESAATGN